MKLGQQRVGVRNRVPRLDGDGNPVRDSFGDAITDVVDVEVRWCAVTPSSRLADALERKNELGDRVEPALTGVSLFAPPGTPIADDSTVIWPITGRATVDGQLRLSGTEYQVVGEPGFWDEAVETRLRRAT